MSHKLQNPALHPAILISPVEDGYLAYNTATDELHRLNPLASLIVELANGRRTIEEICEIAAPLLPADSDQEAARWIDEAISASLLVCDYKDNGGKKASELSAPELAKLADRLRDDGKIQTALICQDRATQLEPENAPYFRHLGELAHIVGRRDEARQAYERYLELRPGDAEIEHLLVSLRDEAAPSRVPDACIEQLYQRFSSFYESNMREELGYEGPEQLMAVVEEAIGDRENLSVLDMGCGTGLAGQQVKSRASRLTGIDLSAQMVAYARELEIYDQLEVAEVTQWLVDAEKNGLLQCFDLIMACDTLIYFGDLSQVIVPAFKLLKPGGVIAFSVEEADDPPFHLTDSGRYVHHLDHIQQVADQLELQVLCREAFLRMEYGREVTALYAVMSETLTLDQANFND